MNRRQFFARTVGAVAAAALWTRTVPVKAIAGFQRLMYRGVPVVYDPACPKNTIYFVNPKTLHVWNTKTGERIDPFVGEGRH